jgi:hypothetical protein
MKLTQPVMIQSFKDEFDLPDDSPHLPASPGEVLTRDAGDPLDDEGGRTYCSDTGKLMHVMKWSRHDILNRARELSRFMAAPTSLHLKRLYRLMSYVRQTAKFGNYIKPNVFWDGSDGAIRFIISGRSDSEYASDPETRRNISGGTVFLFDTVIFSFSRMQKCVTLSVTEAEFVAAVEVVQNMLFACRVLESIGLLVEKPMVIEIDNKGAVDLVNSKISDDMATFKIQRTEIVPCSLSSRRKLIPVAI